MNAKRAWEVIVAIVCAGALAGALAGCASGGAQTGGDAQGITVSGSSETKVVPDKARIRVSVISEEGTAEACQSQNAETVNAVIAALGKLGIQDTSVQTSYSDLSPRYGSRITNASASASSQASGSASDEDADGESASADASPSYDEWAIVGYEMTTTLTVSDLEIENVGAAVQACVAAGANSSDGVEYYASNYDEVYNEALAQALATAHGKAEGIATASGAKLGRVVNVVEGYQDTSARYSSELKAMAATEDAAEGGTIANTMPGQVGITASVTVTYAIA